MASLIPALSDKAKQIVEDTEPHDSVETIKAFQDLFDLEKYPITWEQLFVYLESRSDFRKDYDVPSQIKFIYSWEDEEEGTQIEALYFTRVIYKGELKFFELISDAITRVARAINKRDIDIIGDIHGWWERSQTH